jgi:putative DNA methylase
VRDSSDKRLIEDVIPIDVISRTSASEKVGGRVGHPASLHLWWARRPLAASRAAVYSALAPAEGRTRTLEEESIFFDALCTWGAEDHAIRTARTEILAASKDGPPKVVDLFSGGGAIPLEALRLGCEVTANELNPVAHLIERMLLEFPQSYPGLADDVRQWGQTWVDAAWRDLSDFYPTVDGGTGQQHFLSDDETEQRLPLAYLWTRTVRCPNPAAPEHDAHLVRQTWLGRKKNRVVALKPVVDRNSLSLRYEVVKGATEADLGFDPAEGSRGGQVTCRICGAPVTGKYVKDEARAGRMGTAPLAALAAKPGRRGRDYLAVGEYELPDDAECLKRLEELPVDPLNEPLPGTMRITGGTCMVYGFAQYRDLFTPRQLLALSTLAAGIRTVHDKACAEGMEPGRAAALSTALAMALNRVADRLSSLCRLDTKNEGGTNTFARQALPMVWDFYEANPFAGASGDVRKYLKETADLIERLSTLPNAAKCVRGSAASLPLPSDSQDAVITDPPYYDNISYADLSDFFYVWLKRSVGFLYPTDLGGELTPKRNEAVVAAYRHSGSKDDARRHYEDLMEKAFKEAHRVLKPGAPLVCVYAHKTTSGWSSLVESLKSAGFTITEAWPLDTEMPERAVGRGTASLASSIFLVARKRRPDAGVGSEAEVMAELGQIILERRARLEELGITGSDLVIATVGAGLRALTRYERVEQDNGEVLPAETFLEMVQSRVLDAIFGSLAGTDPVTRYYVAAQFSYGYAAVPFDEANNLARMTGANLDGSGGLTTGPNPLVSKVKSTVVLRDFEDRGDDGRLGQPDTEASGTMPLYEIESSVAPPLIDVAHAVLWRAEHRPAAEVRSYLMSVNVDAVALRQVIQTLAGRALRASSSETKSREASAAERLLVSWRTIVGERGLL